MIELYILTFNAVLIILAALYFTVYRIYFKRIIFDVEKIPGMSFELNLINSAVNNNENIFYLIMALTVTIFYLIPSAQFTIIPVMAMFIIAALQVKMYIYNGVRLEMMVEEIKRYEKLLKDIHEEEILDEKEENDGN